MTIVTIQPGDSLYQIGKRYGVSVEQLVEANGIDPQRGFTTPNMDEALLKAEAMKRAENVYILADGSKFGCISAASFGKLEDACVITDKLNEPDFRRYTIVKETENETEAEEK